MNKKIYLLLLYFFIYLLGYSQQYSVFSGYYHDHYFVNPGSAGSLGSMRLGLGYKNMWSGFHNSPYFNMFSLDLGINEEMGVGGKLFNYVTGPTSRFGFEGTYSYSFKLGSGRLRLGLSGLLYDYRLDKSNFDMESGEDIVLYRGTSERKMVPDASFGVYYHNEKYFLGVSVLQLFGRRIDMENSLFIRQVRHYYLLGGYLFDLSEDFSIEPSIMVRLNETMLYQGDFNLKLKFKSVAFVGISYRGNHNDFLYSPGDAVVGMLGIDIGDLLVCYGYDYLLSDISNYSNGSHELIVVVKLGKGGGVTKL